MTNDMTIPQIRTRLIELAKETGIEELHDLAMQTFRRSNGRKAPPRRRGLNPDLSERIREYAVRHPLTAFHDIADVFGVNIGRVSEAPYGKRK